jgi:hypothetical protein
MRVLTTGGIIRNEINYKVTTKKYPTYKFMMQQVERYLQSNNIDFEDGIIYAGYRTVGSYKIYEITEEKQIEVVAICHGL